MKLFGKTSSLASSFRSRPFALFVIAATAYAGMGVRTASATTFSDPLPMPSVLSDPNITIHIQQAPVQILPGQATNMWTFNGTFPGPTIRRPSGAHTEITFINDLPPAPFTGDPEPAGGMTIHFHGEHSNSVDDGQPDSMHPYGMDPPGCGATLIPIGCSRKYSFDFTEDGNNPERPAFQWYHDHRMDKTGRNVWMGLAGMMILDPPAGDHVEDNLPKGDHDVPIMLADRSFDTNNQFHYTFANAGALGDHVLVNGAFRPYFQVDDAQYRIRVLNASNVRPYDVALSNGASFKQIGTESGLLPTPQTITHIRLGPAERADLVIDFAGQTGQNVILKDLLGFGPDADLMQFQVGTHVTDRSFVPDHLRDLPSTVNVHPVVTRTWLLGQTTDQVNPTWTINGKAFDPMRDDAEPKLGTSERWVFVNTTGVEHLIHIHDVDWVLVARSGGIPPDTGANVDLGQLKETFRVRPFETIVLVSTFTDHTGVFMFHCHILEHEDHSMMAQFNVLPA